MRTIKFRGKRKDNGQWVYGSLHTLVLSNFKLTGNSINIAWIFSPFEPDYKGWDITDTFMKYEVIPESVGQFTGLCDKEGKEIYEGDIYRDEFSIDDEQGIDERLYFVCSYVKSMSAFCWLNIEEHKLYLHEYDKWPEDDEYPYTINADETDKIKIIGNIHDNPELI